MSKPQALLELMTAVDAGLVAVDVSSANLPPRRRGRSQQTAPVAVAPSMETDASFEFSTAVSNSSASPASMVFSDGQLRVHQFPAVRSSAGSSQVLSSSMDSTKAALAESKKRVSFAADRAGKTTQKKGGGLLGCMGSACGLSRDQVVEPGMHGNRKLVVSV
ncbi:unnamed protein product [Alopecurus aequalis]